MRRLRKTIQRARRRILLVRMLDRAGRGTVAGLLAALVVLGVDRLFAIDLPWATFAIVVGVGTIVGAIEAVVRGRPTLEATAARLDETLGLDERLASAFAVETGAVNAASFGALVCADAERVLQGVRVRQAIPAPFPASWVVVVAIVPVLVSGIAYLPARAAAVPAAPVVDDVALAAQSEAIVSALDETRETLRSMPPDVLDVRAQERLEALEALADQMRGTPPDEPDLIRQRDASVATLNDLADEFEDDAARREAALDELAERFDGMQAPQGPLTAEQFDQALKRGDYGAAADAIRRALDAARTDAERERLADDLRDMGRSLREEPDGAAAAEAAERLRQALRDQGLSDEAIDDLLAAPPAEVERELAERDLDEALAERLARDIERWQRQAQAREDAAAAAEDLADALDEAATDVDPTPPPAPVPPANDATDPTPADPSSTRPDDQPDAKPGEQPSAKPGDQPGAKPGDQPDEQPGAKPGDQPGAKPGEQLGAKPGEQPGEKPGEPAPKPDEQPGAKPGDQPGAKPGEQPGEKPGEQPGTKPGEQPGAKPGEQPGAKPGEQPGAKPGDQPGAKPGEQPGEKPGEQPGAKPGEQPGAKPGDQPGAKPGEQPGAKPGEQPGTKPGEQPGAKPGEQPGAKPGEQPGTKPDEQPGAKPGEQPGAKPGEQPGAKPGEQPGTKPDEQPGAKPGEQPGAKPGDQPGAKPGEQPGTKPGDQPGDQPGAMPGDQPGEQPGAQPGDQPGDQPGEPSGDGVARRLRDLQEQVERARQQREAGQAARERAREIAESMTPSEREQMERWAKQFGEDDRGTGAEPSGRAPVAPPADDGSSPPAPAYTTEDVELADADPGDRIIAEWLDDLRGAPDAPGTTRGTDSVRETRRRAEQAIERSNVHPRYRDLVRRYFDRFGDTARKAAEQPATPPSTPTPAPAPASSPTPAPAPPAPAGGGGT